MLNERYDKTIMNSSKINETLWNQSFKDKTVKYFNSKEALHYGMVDDIITFKSKDININKYRSMYGIEG
jgi:hypothetical protein